MTADVAEVVDCPTPAKKQYRSQAEAKKAERQWHGPKGDGRSKLYPYECPSGGHWHLTHHTPEKQAKVFDRDTHEAGLVPTSNTFEGFSIRHVITDEPVWIGRDVCDAVGISKYRDAFTQLDADERVSIVVDTPGGPQRTTGVTEAGVWSLCLISRSPKVKPFKRWLTHEVLPSLRKTGQYSMGSNIALPDRKTLAQWVVEAETRAEVAEAKVVELEPQAAFYRELMDADGKYSMGAAAKAIGWGRNSMMLELRRAGVLTGQNLPYQRFAHHFKVVPQTFTRNGETFATATTYVLPTGLDFLRKKLSRALAVTT